MTADDLTRLRGVISEATGIPNGCCHAGADVHHRHFLHSYVDGSAMKLPWGRFVATFDPPTVAALIDRVERAERQVRHNDELRMGVEKVLDLALGTEPVDGAGEGLVSDVHLLAIRWTEALDRAERAERERDEAWRQANALNHDLSEGAKTLDALRAAVAGLADELSDYQEYDGDFQTAAERIRSLLTEGADDGQ